MICLGVITGVKGIRGEVKIKSFTEDPEDLTAYGPLYDASGKTVFKIKTVGLAKGQLVARIKDVSDRNQAEALKGTELFVSRDKLPDVDDEDAFYYADLIGLKVVLQDDGSLFGKVVQVHDFGAGDMLEVQKEGRREPKIRFCFPLLNRWCRLWTKKTDRLLSIRRKVFSIVPRDLRNRKDSRLTRQIRCLEHVHR